MQLETSVEIPHFHWEDLSEAEPHFHASVTEMEICNELQELEARAEQAGEIWAEQAIERYYEGGWDKTGSYDAEEIMMTAGGRHAYYDPQAA